MLGTPAATAEDIQKQIRGHKRSHHKKPRKYPRCMMSAKYACGQIAQGQAQPNLAA